MGDSEAGPQSYKAYTDQKDCLKCREMHKRTGDEG